jgi:hypothetical protein
MRAKFGAPDHSLGLRWWLWGMVAALAGIAYFASQNGGPHLDRSKILLAGLSGLIVVAALALAYVLAFQHAIERLRSDKNQPLTLIPETELLTDVPAKSYCTNFPKAKITRI